MYIADPVGDFLARIKNAIQRNRKKVQVPSTKMLEAMAEIMQKEGFIESYEVIEMEPQNQLEITCKYVNGESAIRQLERVSKPGRRIYEGYTDVPKKYKGGLGIVIYTTPQGIKSNKQISKLNIGGERLCNIS